MEAKIWYGGGDGYAPTGDVHNVWKKMETLGECKMLNNVYLKVKSKLWQLLMGAQWLWNCIHWYCDGLQIELKGGKGGMWILVQGLHSPRGAPSKTWGKLGCRNAFGLPWAVTTLRVIRCQTNFTRSQLFAIYKLLRQQACSYSMLRCIKHWQDVRNHGCGALGVDHSLSNKLSRPIQVLTTVLQTFESQRLDD